MHLELRSHSESEDFGLGSLNYKEGPLLNSKEGTPYLNDAAHAPIQGPCNF